MASLVLSGDTSGSITVSAPAVAGSNTQTLVATTGTLAPIVSGTAITLTNQTAPEFTGIPSWVKRITVMLSGVSTNSTGAILIQLGDAGGYETTGYVGTGTSNSTGASPVTSNFTTGFGLASASVAAQTNQGIATICLLGSNNWVFSFVGGRDNAVDLRGAGTKTLSDTLTSVRLYIDGTQQFDAGTINILYE
jgi:hypothetical protein